MTEGSAVCGEQKVDFAEGKRRMRDNQEPGGIVFIIQPYLFYTYPHFFKGDSGFHFKFLPGSVGVDISLYKRNFNKNTVGT